MIENDRVNREEKAYYLDVRLVMTCKRQQQRPRYLVTNLPRNQFSNEQVCDGYLLGEQIELMFKEWKSYDNLHAFDTRKSPPIAEGFIWVSMYAAILRRFLAYTTQRVYQVDISMRKSTMSLRYVLTEIFLTLMHHG